MQIDSAVVLAAGEGRRLRPLTAHRPKPMLPVAGRPILEHVLDAVLAAGVTDLHLVVGYGRDRIQDHVGPTYRGHPVTYHRQESQLGSGHALLAARDAVDADFLAVNGDEVVAEAMVRAVVDAHTVEDVATLALVERADAAEYGAVRLDGDAVTEITEKPGGGGYALLNVGVYALCPSIFEVLEDAATSDGEFPLTDAIDRALDRGGRVRGVTHDGRWTDVAYPWDLLELGADLLGAGTVQQPRRRRGVFVADGAAVHDDATLYPPVVVDADAVVEPGAVVGPNVALGPNTTVAANATLRQCIVDEDSRIGAGATLVESVTGTGVTVGAGVTVPAGPADVRVGTTVHVDEHLGAVIADRATVGGGATVTPGTLVGSGATIEPGTVVHRNVAADSGVSR